MQTQRNSHLRLVEPSETKSAESPDDNDISLLLEGYNIDEALAQLSPAEVTERETIALGDFGTTARYHMNRLPGDSNVRWILRDAVVAVRKELRRRKADTPNGERR